MGAAAKSESSLIEIGDAALVEAVRRGDRRAEERLVTRYAPLLGALTARLLRSRHDAEDVTQDAFIVAFTQLDRLRDPGAFRGWLIRIAILRTREILRRRRIARAIGLDFKVEDVTLESAAAETVSGEERAELALLDRVLGTMNLDHRLAWMLRHVEGMELREVAESLDCSLATVKRRIAAANQVVREHFDVDSEAE